MAFSKAYGPSSFLPRRPFWRSFRASLGRPELLIEDTLEGGALEFADFELPDFFDAADLVDGDEDAWDAAFSLST